MTADESAFLARYGGVEPASAAQLSDLHARSAARVRAEATRALSRSEIAGQLEVAPSRISHQVAAGQLYSYLGSGRRPLFPDWQIIVPDGSGRKAGVLPRLSDVIAAIPRGSHPVTVRSFMTNPSPSLTAGDGSPISPRDWLISGGDADVVAELATTLGEQV